MSVPSEPVEPQGDEAAPEAATAVTETAAPESEAAAEAVAPAADAAPEPAEAAPEAETAPEAEPTAAAEPEVPTEAAAGESKTAPRPVPSPASLLGRAPAPSISFGTVSDDGAVFLRLPDGSEHQVGQWATGNPAQALEFYANKYADLVTEIDLAAKRLADDRATPAQALATVQKIREALLEPAFVGDVAALISRVGQLEVLVSAKKAAASEAKGEEKKRIAEAREKLVTEAESLTDSQAWRVSTERFKEIVEEWKVLPRGDRTSENAQWKRLSAARTAFDKRRRVHYAELEATRDSAKAAKEKLVKEAQALSSSRDWAKTTTAYRGLLDKWKQAGRAGKSDDALWEQFRAAQDAFFSARNETYKERDGEESANLELKEKLLAEAEALLPIKDLRTAKKSLRIIQEKWEKVGHIPRNDIKRVEAKLKVVEDAIRGAEGDKWKVANPELRGRAADTVTGFKEKIAKLEKQLKAAQDSGNEAAAKKAQDAIASANMLLDAAERGLAKFS